MNIRSLNQNWRLVHAIFTKPPSIIYFDKEKIIEARQVLSENQDNSNTVCCKISKALSLGVWLS